jgi:hypothetical protein
MVVTDGDSQETSQLDMAMKKHFPQAIRGRCIWHIVKRGMDKYFPKPLCRKNADYDLYRKWEVVKADVQNWIWSWSDSRCETKEEFQLSKDLFIKYLASNKVKEALGQEGVEQLHDFYCKRIEPHEDLFVFYRRRHLFHFDTNSNSAHEGTNHGIKYHSLPVKPTHGIVESTRILTQKSKLKASDRKLQAAQYDHSKSGVGHIYPQPTPLPVLVNPYYLCSGKRVLSMKLLDPIIIIGLLVGAATKSQQFQVVKYTQGFVEYAACAETTS